MTDRRDSEIAVCKAGHIAPVLHQNRLIQPQPDAHLLHLFGRRARAGRHLGFVPRNQSDHDKDDRDQTDQRHHQRA